MSQNISKFVLINKDTHMPFNKIYHLYYIKIYQFIYRLSLSQQDSEDITQEIFLTLYKEIIKNRFPENTKAWLYRCALNKFINTKKKNKPIKLTSNINDLDYQLTDSIENDIFKKEKKDQINNALACLSEKEQILLNLYNEDFSYKEISTITEIKLSSVGKTLSRVIEKLAKQIKLSHHEKLLDTRNIV